MAKAVLGQAKGDLVEIPSLYEPAVYTIEAVQSIYLRAYQDTLENFGTWFPGDKSLSKVHVEDHDPTKVLQIVAGHSVQMEEIYHTYERGELTLGQFANAAGKNEIEAWGSIIGKPNHRLLASTGSPEEQARIFQWLELRSRSQST